MDMTLWAQSTGDKGIKVAHLHFIVILRLQIRPVKRLVICSKLCSLLIYPVTQN